MPPRFAPDPVDRGMPAACLPDRLDYGLEPVIANLPMGETGFIEADIILVANDGGLYLNQDFRYERTADPWSAVPLTRTFDGFMIDVTEIRDALNASQEHLRIFRPLDNARIVPIIKVIDEYVPDIRGY